MSHFNVIVIGDDLEKQLAPYHEFECTGNDDQYVQDFDITDEVRTEIEIRGLKNGLEYFGLDKKIVKSENEVDKSGLHKYRYVVIQNGHIVKAIKRTNPNVKWDWYSIGGRWTGYFSLKPGVIPVLGTPGVFGNKPDKHTGDQARLKDIDIEGMRCRAEDEAKADFDYWQKIFIEHGKPESWTSIRDRISDFDKVHEQYRSQPAIKAYYNSEQAFLMECPVKIFGFDRNIYIQKCRDNALTPFAFVKDGKWYERGNMGWFGVVMNQKDRDEWSLQFNQLLENLHPDTLLTIVDCHI